MNIYKTYTFSRPKFFDINQIFDCGQCFRFKKCEGNDNRFEGVALGKYISVSQTDDEITLEGADCRDYENLWKHYFALDEDYSQIREDIANHFENDKTIISAMEKGKGIRILHQDPWETICSFIISQNNNIPRIRKIITSLSEKYGEKITYGNNAYYTFPSPESLYEAGTENIFALKTGFRAKYIYDAAEKVVSGKLDIQKISGLCTDELIENLMTVKGIGKKVASCAALFGFGKTDAFPIDVWMKKVISEYYPDGLNIQKLGKYAGLAQQYLFYYERYQG